MLNKNLIKVHSLFNCFYYIENFSLFFCFLRRLNILDSALVLFDVEIYFFMFFHSTEFRIYFAYLILSRQESRYFLERLSDKSCFYHVQQTSNYSKILNKSYITLASPNKILATNR